MVASSFQAGATTWKWFTAVGKCDEDSSFLKRHSQPGNLEPSTFTIGFAPKAFEDDQGTTSKKDVC